MQNNAKQKEAISEEFKTKMTVKFQVGNAQKRRYIFWQFSVKSQTSFLLKAIEAQQLSTFPK